ncbi:MAG: tRNA pseudouridine(55) synthase TruB [Thermodesulfobacteriota bacterium]
MVIEGRSPDPSGVLVVDKPGGLTSFAVVRRIGRAAGVKKAGHTGSLDPMATGVLPVCLGRATKLVPYLQAGAKEYEGRLVLGLTTETDDVTGRVTVKKSVSGLAREEIERAAAEFVGSVWQVPPAYSAIKIEGRPAYALARRGEKVPARARMVVIQNLVLTEVLPPLVSFRVRVSKGTYVRSLVADLGRRLGIGACLESLRRLASEPFTLAQAVPLTEAENLARSGRLEERLVSLEEALSFLPGVNVPEPMARLVDNGRPLPLSGLEDFTPPAGPVRIQTEGRGLLAIYEYNPSREARGECLTPLRVLGRNQSS